MGLKATELRIGNLFTEINTKKVISVIELTKDNITFSGRFKNDWKAEPIPITKEWLVKLGFDKQIGFYKMYEGVKFNLGGKSLEVMHNDSDNYYCYIRNFNKGELDDFVCLRNDLKYVHQLQNLYFAITGTELAI